MQIACIDTYATLCIHSDTDANLADTVLRVSGLRPSRVAENTKRSFGGFSIPRYGWFLTSKDAVDSLEVSDHIEWILTQLGDNHPIRTLLDTGYRAKIICLWVSGGQGGGPVLANRLLHMLDDQGLDIEFDVYFEDVERH